ncbi:hypothetical protein [Brucella pseudogrignonensis]|uniref:hypothetical protein n=1 Tax=Brucella pseudogrignonensis TaxID=419475 RepID=UPI001F1B238C|nr:hypothetical protein [Brucella pseudogrignonensis]
MMYRVEDFELVDGVVWQHIDGTTHILAEGMTISQHVDALNNPAKPIIQEDVKILPAVTLWERLTEAEADQVNEAMATQPVRTQRIFTTANTFRSDHDLWPLLQQMATALFGAERAAELLAG